MEYPYKITLIKELLLRNLSPQVLLDSDCQYNQKETDAVVLWEMLGEEIKEAMLNSKTPAYLSLPANNHSIAKLIAPKQVSSIDFLFYI